MAWIGPTDDSQPSTSRVDSTKLYQTTNLQNKDNTDLVDSKLLNLNQIDPDCLFQILTENVDECLFYDASKTPPTAIRNNKFLIIHINISPLHKHHGNLVNSLALCRSPPDIICITETRLQAESLIDVDLPGYTFIRENSPTIVGGVAMYIKKSIKFERPGKYNFEVSGCENIWIDVKLNNNKSLISETVYKHPKQNPSSFIEKFSEIFIR